MPRPKKSFEDLVSSALPYKKQGRSSFFRNRPSDYIICVQRRILDDVFSAAGYGQKYKHQPKIKPVDTHINKFGQKMTTTRVLSWHFKIPHTKIIKNLIDVAGSLEKTDWYELIDGSYEMTKRAFLILAELLDNQAATDEILKSFQQQEI